jgi:formiminotetrahydrofolate cyclodeaminase
MRLSVLAQMTLREFNEVLGSKAPAPGGGSVAALSGSLGAELVSMVCNLTIGRQGHESFTVELTAALAKARALADSLLQRVDLDTQAFNEVMAAFKLPKQTEAEQSARRDAVQQGYKKAIHSPLAIAHECVDVLKLAAGLVGKTNPNALSDLGVAAQQAYAGLEGAIMNVKINIPSIKEEGFVKSTRDDIAALLEDGQGLARKVRVYVGDNL